MPKPRTTTTCTSLRVEKKSQRFISSSTHPYSSVATRKYSPSLLTMARNLANASCVVLPVEGETVSISCLTETLFNALSAEAFSGEPTDGEEIDPCANGLVLRAVNMVRCGRGWGTGGRAKHSTSEMSNKLHQSLRLKSAQAFNKLHMSDARFIFKQEHFHRSFNSEPTFMLES